MHNQPRKNHAKINAFNVLIGSMMAASPAYAFIPGPPLTTLSGGLVVLNFGLFVLSFFMSVVFQGWLISHRHHEIGLLSSSLKALSVKILFLLYALPLILLCDFLGLSLGMAIYKIPFLEGLDIQIWLMIIAYAVLVLSILAATAGHIEYYIFSKLWPTERGGRLYWTSMMSNAFIFAAALVILVVNKP